MANWTVGPALFPTSNSNSWWKADHLHHWLCISSNCLSFGVWLNDRCLVIWWLILINMISSWVLCCRMICLLLYLCSYVFHIVNIRYGNLWRFKLLLTSNVSYHVFLFKILVFPIRYFLNRYTSIFISCQNRMLRKIFTKWKFGVLHVSRGNTTCTITLSYSASTFTSIIHIIKLF